MHIDYSGKSQSATQSANSEISKCKNCTLEELAILRTIAQNHAITQKELAATTVASERTIKRRTVDLQDRCMISIFKRSYEYQHGLSFTIRKKRPPRKNIPTGADGIGNR